MIISFGKMSVDIILDRIDWLKPAQRKRRVPKAKTNNVKD
jgi:hypothetical protein